MAKCSKCKKSIKAGIRYNSKRRTICESCLEEELKNVEWTFGSEISSEDECDEKGVYNDEDYVFVKENGKWVSTDMYFTLFT